MTHKEFMEVVEEAFITSKNVLEKKAPEYAEDNDRLINFKQSGAAQGIPPTQALVGMASKHFISVAKMAKCPTLYNLEQWTEKLVDLRNYTFLLDALLRDLSCYKESDSI